MIASRLMTIILSVFELESLLTSLSLIMDSFGFHEADVQMNGLKVCPIGFILSMDSTNYVASILLLTVFAFSHVELSARLIYSNRGSVICVRDDSYVILLFSIGVSLCCPTWLIQKKIMLVSFS